MSDYKGPMGIFEGYGENMTVTEDTKGGARQEREAFTPGPWRVVPESKGIHGAYVEDDTGRTVCDLYFLRDTTEPVLHHKEAHEANAHLIAAAPDLYEALLPLVRGTYWLTDADVQRAEKALSKARGETNE